LRIRILEHLGDTVRDPWTWGNIVADLVGQAAEAHGRSESATDSPLVSVVIPAFNAAATLDETLRSVRSQTHRALEIIVVDDGSTDDTRALAQRHAAVDDRVLVVTQDNAGVAAARNEGVRRGRSGLIAFLDADDLWAPTKIERQLQALQAGGPRVGLVYCWYVEIDDRASISPVEDRGRPEGDVLDSILVWNFIGNCSSVLVRRQAFIDAGGFDEGFRAAGAEGCEDFLLWCRVAERHRFAVVPEHLIGYRCGPESMSTDRPRMLRSWLLVHDAMLARHPDQSAALRHGVRHYGGYLAREALSHGEVKQLPSLLLALLRCHPSVAMRVLVKDVSITVIERVRAWLGSWYRGPATPVATATGPRFLIGDPDTDRDT
jgi:glycosyltransferase involved in cell wall biosynthesis